MASGNGNTVLSAFSGRINFVGALSGPKLVHGDMMRAEILSSDANAKIILDHEPTAAELKKLRPMRGKWLISGAVNLREHKLVGTLKIGLPPVFWKAEGSDELIEVQDAFEVGKMYVRGDPISGPRAVIQGDTGTARIELVGVEAPLFVTLFAHNYDDITLGEGETVVYWRYQLYSADKLKQKQERYARLMAEQKGLEAAGK